MVEGGPTLGSGTRAQIGRPLAGKTGTAQNYTSSFFVGYTPQLATAVWVGHPRTPRPMTNLFNGGPVFGGTYPALIFSDFMRAAMANKPVRHFPAPPAPPTVGVPDLVGRSPEEARRLLAAVGLRAELRGSGGLVVATRPGAGTRIRRGSSVEVLLGDTVPSRNMPAVTGLPLPVAAVLLAQAGVRVRVTYQPVTDPRTVGRVLRQSPSAGARLPPDAAATLVVGRLR